MLPDYPLIKDKIYKKIILKRHQTILNASLGSLASIPQIRHFEGEFNDDGSGKGPREYHEITSELSISSAELETMTPQQVLERLDVMLMDMVRQRGEYMIHRFSEIAEADSGIIAAGKSPLNADVFLEAIEKLYVEFDANNQPDISGFDYIGPQGCIPFEVLRKHLLNTPETQVRYDTIIKKKWEEWRDRESSRKLVG